MEGMVLGNEWWLVVGRWLGLQHLRPQFRILRICVAPLPVPPFNPLSHYSLQNEAILPASKHAHSPFPHHIRKVEHSITQVYE